MLIFPPELEEVQICEALGLTEKELYETSHVHIQKRLLLLGARNKADNEKAKQRNKQG